LGGLSRVTALTVKTLRFYHQEGVLVPSRVDPPRGTATTTSATWRRRGITYLRSLDVPPPARPSSATT
jgi:DNA-binding transcriptional MerR regulator